MSETKNRFLKLSARGESNGITYHTNVGTVFYFANSHIKWISIPESSERSAELVIKYPSYTAIIWAYGVKEMFELFRKNRVEEVIQLDPGEKIDLEKEPLTITRVRVRLDNPQ